MRAVSSGVVVVVEGRERVLLFWYQFVASQSTSDGGDAAFGLMTFPRIETWNRRLSSICSDLDALYPSRCWFSMFRSMELQLGKVCGHLGNASPLDISWLGHSDSRPTHPMFELNALIFLAIFLFCCTSQYDIDD